MKKLPRSFYLQPTLTVAKQLLGKILVRKIGDEILSGKIVEVETYLGENDPASHAYRGKTKRNEVMFQNGGHLYVYFTYGMHFCANIVTEETDKGRAVLIRAVEPLTGIEIMKKNRKRVFTAHSLMNLTNGPAKFCQAFGIEREHNGTDLLGSEIYLTDGVDIPASKIVATTRIGIKNGVEKKWRFYIKGNPLVSK
jgi:DNA-3-methyladenine glycosylase